MQEEKAKEYIRHKSYEVVNAYLSLQDAKESFLLCADRIRKGESCMQGTYDDARRMYEAFLKYDDLRFNVSQFAHMLGEEYVRIYEEIVNFD